MRTGHIFRITLLGLMFFPSLIRAQEIDKGDPPTEPQKLLVFWTSGDRDVALKTTFPYTFYAKKQGWFDEVKLLVWGPSSKLLAEDAELQEFVEKMGKQGVTLIACKMCSDSYGVSQELIDLGIDVKYTGKPLSDMLKSGWHVLTF